MNTRAKAIENLIYDLPMMKDDEIVPMHADIVRKLMVGYRPQSSPDPDSVTWIPSERNPSKLIEHHWNGREWVKGTFQRFVKVIKENQNA